MRKLIIKASAICNRNILVIKNINEFVERLRQYYKKYDYAVVLDSRSLVSSICLIYKNDYPGYKTITEFRFISDEEEINIEESFDKPLIVKNKQNIIIGIITVNEHIKFLLEQICVLKNQLNQVETDLNAFMISTNDLVCISDGSGSKVRVSASSEKLYGIKSEDLVGQNVKDLERKGMYTPSATRMVIEEKKQVSIIQKTKTGRSLLVTAIPVFDDEGKIKRVISISKDITDADKLKLELQQTKRLLHRYEIELATHRMEAMRDSIVVCKSKNMEELLEMLNRVASVDTTILINGETGVGKEVIAKYIHSISNRSKGPFIKINCGAIPENLIESELFGYEKGAFTGARSDGKPGLIEIADGGTLLLDEISELALHLQVKLLRVLQEKEFIRTGGIKTVSVDVRIIAATNKDLKKMVQNGEFREDLYYRLNVFPVVVPPLRERLEDIPILSHHFLKKYNEKYGYKKQVTKEVIEYFMRYSWPGNVRELENVIERLIVSSKDNQITIKDLPSEIYDENEIDRTGGVFVSKLMPLREANAFAEYQLIQMALKEGGSTYKAAELLGVDQSTIVRKLKKHKTLID